MPQDRSGHEYRRTPRGGEFIRTTYVEEGFTGTPAIRIQVDVPGEGLRQGPEIQIGIIRQVMGSIEDLLGGPVSG